MINITDITLHPPKTNMESENPRGKGKMNM